jgi:hypothetical protein
VLTIYSGVHVDGAAKLVAQTTLLAAGETAALRGAMLATRSSMWVAAGSVIRTMRLDTHMVDNSLMGHAAPVVSLAHACGETVWSGDELGEIRAWSIADSTCVRKIRAAPTIAPPLSAVYALARVGAFVAAAIGSRVLLYSVTASTTAAQSEPALELASRHNEVAVVGVAPFQTDGMTFLVAAPAMSRQSSGRSTDAPAIRCAPSTRQRLRASNASRVKQ